MALNLPAIIIGILLSFVVPSVLFGGVSPFSGILYAPIGGFLGLLISETQFAPQQLEETGIFKNTGWLFHKPIKYFSLEAIIGLGIVIIGLWKGRESGLVAGLSFGLSSLLVYLFLRQKQKKSSQTIDTRVPEEHKWYRFFINKHVRVGCLIGLSYGLSAGLVQAIDLVNIFQQSYTSPAFGQHYGLYYGLFSGMFSGLQNDGLCIGIVGGFLSVILSGRDIYIRPAERITWSWTSLRQSLLTRGHGSSAFQVLVVIGGLIGISMWLANNMSIWLSGWLSHADGSVQFGLDQVLIAFSQCLGNGLITGLSIAFCYWLILGLFQGVSSTNIDDRHRTRPNQGIQQSRRNGLILGSVGGVICGIIGFLILLLNTEMQTVLSWPSPFEDSNCDPPVSVWQEIVSLLRLPDTTTTTQGCVSLILSPPPDYTLAQQLTFALSKHLNNGLGIGLVNGLVIGLVCGLLIAMLKGMLAWYQHWVLRILLWRQHAIPWNVVSFLDNAVEQVLLQKVGGGYIFIHRSLLDYFASLDTESTAKAAQEQQQTENAL